MRDLHSNPEGQSELESSEAQLVLDLDGVEGPIDLLLS